MQYPNLKRLKHRIKRSFAVQGRWVSLVHYRMVLSCGVVFLLLSFLDIGAATLIRLHPGWGAALRALPLDIDFAPEVWLSILGVTLGTLVIAISIAAQNIPKITELYMQDWFSLFYMWFAIGGACHAVIAKSLMMFRVSRPSSLLLNVTVLLPIAVLIVFPYVFYVLGAIQPNTVIDKIYRHHLIKLRRLTDRRFRGSLQNRRKREDCHQELLTSLNQLETFVEYLTFTEPKLQIIQRLSQLLQTFIVSKAQIDPHFFRISAAVRSDVSFQTMIDQFPMLKNRPTFYEQKVFRLFGNAYAQFLEAANFDLAALCGAELRRIGSVATSVQEQSILNLVAIRFNTMLRFALKHGANHNEGRNLYTLIFHYRGFIEDLVRQGDQNTAQHCFHYLRIYGNEAYALGQRSPALYFIVNVFAAEMRSLLILVHAQSWPLDAQQGLLKELLKVDSPPQTDPLSPDLKHLNSGVRALQISLALFYLDANLHTFTDYIVEDLLDDLKVLGKPLFQEAIREICDRLQSAQPTFWEDTDRGNTNLYYTPHLQHLQDFRSRLQIAADRMSKS